MKDELSREDLTTCLFCLANSLGKRKRPVFCNKYSKKKDVPWHICARSLHTIKSRLTPVPEAQVEPSVKKMTEQEKYELYMFNKPKSPKAGPSEEWIKEKAEKLLSLTSDKDFSYSVRLGNAEDFIRQIAEEYKPKELARMTKYPGTEEEEEWIRIK